MDMNPENPLRIYALNEFENESWIKVIGFYDEKREGFVYIPPKSKIMILGKKFQVTKGKPFTYHKDHNRILEGDDIMFYSDDCLLNDKGNTRSLREFLDKYVERLQ